MKSESEIEQMLERVGAERAEAEDDTMWGKLEAAEVTLDWVLENSDALDNVID